MDAKVWVITGYVENALATKGVRSRLYRLADSNISYYNSNHPKTIYYINDTLWFSVLFETKDHALQFESQFLNEQLTVGSPLNGMTVVSNGCEESPLPQGNLQRIYFKDYVPMDSESPQDTQSQITTEYSMYEHSSDEFKYQRIEADWVFGPVGKAESCHLMSSAHCKKYSSYQNYDSDKSNRLAMSRDLHGFYDALSSFVPAMNLNVLSVSDAPVLDDRYKVILEVKVLTADYKATIFNRLKPGSTHTDNPLVMTTFVHILNPTIFRNCMAWKFRMIEKIWEDYYSMNPAVD